MKKSAFPTTLLLTLVGVSGCPIYDHEDSGCFDHSDCASGYLCDDATGSCYAEDESIGCEEPSDCGTNETCGRTGTCSIGDCHFPSVGCVRGYVCSAEEGRWACVREADGQGGVDGSGGVPATAGAPASGGTLGSGGEQGQSGGTASEAGSPAGTGEGGSG